MGFGRASFQQRSAELCIGTGIILLKTINWFLCLLTVFLESDYEHQNIILGASQTSVLFSKHDHKSRLNSACFHRVKKLSHMRKIELKKHKEPSVELS